MVRVVFLFCFCFCLFGLRAQDNLNSFDGSLLRTSGSASKKVISDLLDINFYISTVDEDYQTSVSLSANKFKRLKKAINKAGIKDNMLKVRGYNVNKQYDYSNQNKKKLVYNTSYDINLTISNEKKLIDNVFSSIEGVKDIELSLFFKLSDDKLDKVKKDLLSQAIKNAKQSAEHIAANIGVKLGKVKDIIYNYDRLEDMPPIYRRQISSSLMSGRDVSNSEVEHSEKVYIVWLILK